MLPARPSRSWDFGTWGTSAWILVTTAIFFSGICAHLDPLNGPWYWKWPWRQLPLARVGLLLAPSLLTVLWVATSARSPAGGSSVAFRLCLLGLGVLWGQFAGALAEPPGLGFLGDVVRSPAATSYFSDALRIRGVRSWLSTFPPPDLALHSRTHPPGPILFYVLCIRLAGAEAAPFLGGALLATAVGAGVFLVFAFASLWTADAGARLLACCYYALVPAVTLFFPEFDQLYPLVTMGLAILWARACEGNARAAVAAGLVFAGGAFFAYNLLALGCLPILWILGLVLGERSRRSFPELGKVVGWACLGSIAFEAFLAAALGYHPIRSLAAALENQRTLASGYDRPYFPCAMLDPYDFLVGFGMCSLPLLLLQLDRGMRDSGWRSKPWRVSVVFLAAIVIVDASGLLRAETSRVWMFLYPLLLAPLSAQLETLGPWDVRALLASEWGLLVALKANLVHIAP